jgi:hypothetical protein
MADIAAGKGKRPKPFILATKHKALPKAIRNSNKDSANALCDVAEPVGFKLEAFNSRLPAL